MCWPFKVDRFQENHLICLWWPLSPHTSFHLWVPGTCAKTGRDQGLVSDRRGGQLWPSWPISEMTEDVPAVAILTNTWNDRRCVTFGHPDQSLKMCNGDYHNSPFTRQRWPVTRHSAASLCLLPRWPPSWQPHVSTRLDVCETILWLCVDSWSGTLYILQSQHIFM